MKAKINFWQGIGNPKTAIAPMVDYSDLPFRILCRKYGTQLSYTQMFNSSNFALSSKVRTRAFKEINQSLDNPCFVQLCGHDPELLLKSAQYLQNFTPCVDLNLGCPQKIAKNGHYGAYLLDHPDEVYKIVGYLCNNNLSCGISCKIRLYNDLSKTFELVRKLEDLGISVLCVHGRTKEQNKERMGSCNWDAIRKIKSILNIPVIANGGIGNFEDVERCFEYTKCDCVMSGEKLIEMPTLFSGKLYDIDDIALEYLDIWEMYRKEDIQANLSVIRGHVAKFYYQACKMWSELNKRIAECESFEGLRKIGMEIKEMRKDVNVKEKYTWYMRYRNKKKKEEKVEDNLEEEDIGGMFD